MSEQSVIDQLLEQAEELAETDRGAELIREARQLEQSATADADDHPGRQLDAVQYNGETCLFDPDSGEDAWLQSSVAVRLPSEVVEQ